MLETVRIEGAAPGTTSIIFGQQVSSLLLIVGFPNNGGDPRQFGASRWDFADALSVDIVDTGIVALTRFLQVLPGNIVENPGVPPNPNHVSGVFRVEGGFSALSFDKIMEQVGTFDTVNVMFAAQFVPEPSIFPILLFGLAIAGTITRRRQPCRTVL